MRCFSLLALLLSTTIQAQYQITGTVTNAETGEPLVSAPVQIQGTYLRTFTSTNGEFKITGLAQDRYTLVVTYMGFEDHRQEIDIYANVTVNVQMVSASILGPTIVVSATRADERMPVAQSTLDRDEIAAVNSGKDMPYVLEQLPSTVVTSDAGNGVGYSSMRIRGSDITRINVTINGIPINDAEPHGVWWVDLPDLASSTDNIQVQRGVGTSTLGAGAFGATVNLQTNTLKRDPYGEIGINYGSFNTSRTTAQLGSGLVKNRWSFDGRLSRLHSDGFIDRATADLTSWFVSGAYHGRRTLITANVFSGHEVSYLAWYGVHDSLLASHPTYNAFTYDNEVDDYRQTHHQLLWSSDLGSGFFLNAAGHYTHGEGFYEQYLSDQSLPAYGLDTSLAATSDLVTRRWLDNDFYGLITSLRYDPGKKLKAVAGGGWNNYLGHHFGEVIWAQVGSDSIGQRYYDNEATKRDFNAFGKLTLQVSNGIQLFADMQLRQVGYTFLGLNDSAQPATQTVNHSFINPKGGVSLKVGSTGLLYLFVGMANREPIRDDYVGSTPSNRPQPERLLDYELGYKLNLRRIAVLVNGFYMSYTDQLVITGQINDVGAYTRRNVASSYRAGAELEWQADIVKGLRWQGNFTYSINKIAEFIEFIDNLDSMSQALVDHIGTDIALSPGVVLSSNVTYAPVKGLEVAVITKFVGRQFLDNTSNMDRSLPGFMVHDLRASYTFAGWKGVDKLTFMAAVNNVLDEVYVPSGYTYSYILGGQTFTDNYNYPQAGRHFTVGGRLRF